jgi:hypothetical protein
MSNDYLRYRVRCTVSSQSLQGRILVHMTPSKAFFAQFGDAYEKRAEAHRGVEHGPLHKEL